MWRSHVLLFMSCTAMFPARLKCSRRDKGKSSRVCLRFGQTIAPGARAVAIGPADPEAWDSLLEGAKAAPLLPSGSPGIGASVRGLALRAGTGGCSFRRLDCEISSMASTSASSSFPSSPSKIPGRIFQSSSSSSGTGGKSLETAFVVGISLGFSISSSISCPVSLSLSSGSSGIKKRSLSILTHYLKRNDWLAIHDGLCKCFIGTGYTDIVGRNQNRTISTQKPNALWTFMSDNPGNRRPWGASLLVVPARRHKVPYRKFPVERDGVSKQCFLNPTWALQMRVCFLSFKPSLVLQCKGAGRVMSGCSCAQGCMFLFGCKGWKCSGSSPKNPLARRKASKSGSVSLDLRTLSQNWLSLFFRVGTCFTANLSVHRFKMAPWRSTRPMPSGVLRGRECCVHPWTGLTLSNTNHFCQLKCGTHTTHTNHVENLISVSFWIHNFKHINAQSVIECVFPRKAYFVGWFLRCGLLACLTAMQTDCINDFLANLGSPKEIDHDLFRNVSELALEPSDSNPDPLGQLLNDVPARLQADLGCRRRQPTPPQWSGPHCNGILCRTVLGIHDLIKWILIQSFLNLIGHSCWECSEHLII